jgi:hypothetical protein
MRVTTDFWVSSILRRAFSAGGFAAVARRGASEAGAVMLTQRDRMGQTRLYGPAPQTSYEDAKPDQRLFVEILSADDEQSIREKIEREVRFDPDIWVVELEVDDALFAELVPITTP